MPQDIFTTEELKKEDRPVQSPDNTFSTEELFGNNAPKATTPKPPETFTTEQLFDMPPEHYRNLMKTDQTLSQGKQKDIFGNDLIVMGDTSMTKQAAEGLRRSKVIVDSFKRGLFGGVDHNKELTAEHPIASAIGEGVGGLIGLAGVSGITSEVGKKVLQEGIKQYGLKELPKILTAARAAQSAATFGVKGAMDKAVQAAQGEDVGLNTLEDIGNEIAFGGTLGLTGSIAKPLMRIPAETLFGYATAKIQGADNPHAAVNGAVFGLFGALNRADLNIEARKTAVGEIQKNLSSKLVELNKGLAPKAANAQADQFIYGSAQKITGEQNPDKAIEKVLLSKENSLQYLDQLNEHVKNFKPAEKPVEPKKIGAITPTPTTETAQPAAPAPQKPQMIKDAENHGTVVGIDAGTKLPIIDTTKPAVTPTETAGTAAPVPAQAPVTNPATPFSPERRNPDMIPPLKSHKNRLADWTPLIDAYDTPEGKKYQIDRLNVPDSIKGRLYQHYGLFDTTPQSEATNGQNVIGGRGTLPETQRGTSGQGGGESGGAGGVYRQEALRKSEIPGNGYGWEKAGEQKEGVKNIGVDEARTFDKEKLINDIAKSLVVEPRMISSIHDPKILNSVIQRVPVDVVNAFGGKEFTAQMLLHYPSVFLDAFSINPKILYSSAGININAVLDRVATARAEIKARASLGEINPTANKADTINPVSTLPNVVTAYGTKSGSMPASESDKILLTALDTFKRNATKVMRTFSSHPKMNTASGTAGEVIGNTGGLPIKDTPTKISNKTIHGENITHKVGQVNLSTPTENKNGQKEKDATTKSAEGQVPVETAGTDPGGENITKKDVTPEGYGPDIINKKIKTSKDIQASGSAGKIDDYEPSGNTQAKQAAFKLSDRVVALVKKYAARFGEDYHPKGSAGAHFGDTGNIFVNAKNDVAIAAHEVTHYLDKKIGFTAAITKKIGETSDGKPKYDPATKKIRKQLTDIYLKYYPDALKDHPLKKRVTEGVAVFFQRFVSHPNQTMREYPEVYNEFLAKSGRYYDPIMSEFSKEFRKIVEDYQSLSDLDKIGARVVDAEIMKDKPFLNIREAAIYKNIDNKYPLEKLAKEAGVHFTEHDPSLISRIYDHVPAIIQHNFSDSAFVGLGPWGFGKETYLSMKPNGEIFKAHDFNWHTLVNKIGANTDDFNSWLVARRVVQDFKNLETKKKAFLAAVKEMKNAKESGIEMDAVGMRELAENANKAKEEYQAALSIIKNNRFDKEVATRAFEQNEDRFKDEAKMFDSLVKSDLDLAKSAGMVSDARYEKMAAEPGYATFKRQIENEIVGTGEGVSAPKTVKVGRNKVSSLFTYGGSAKDIVSPVYSSMENHSEIFKKATRQIIYNTIGDLAGKFPELFQKLPLESFQDDTGRIVYPQDKDPNIMMAYSNGRRIPYLVNKELKTMLDNMLTPTSVQLVEKIFTGLAQAFTKGTTGFYVQFAATNFFIDQLSATSNSWTRYKPIYTPISELVKALSNRESPDSKYAMEYFMLGGERQAFLSFSDLNPKEAYDFIKSEKNMILKAIDILNAGGDILSAPVKSTELLTRMSEFVRARKEGYSQLAALELAGRISTPFHHRGQKGDVYRFLTRSIPYLNASIQVLAQEARALKSPKSRGRAMMMFAIISAAALAGIASILNASDKQKRILKSLPPEQLGRYVFFPSTDGKTLIRIRVPQEKMALVNTLNMAILDSQLNAKYSAYEYLRGATGWVPDQINPTDPARMLASWIPQAVSPAVQVTFNKRFYPTIRDLEPDYMKYLPKDQRVYDTTSNIAKYFGPRLGLSPIQFDTLLQGYGGRFTRYASGQGVENPFIQQMYFQGSRQMIAFYAERAKNDQEYKYLKTEPGKYNETQEQEIRNEHFRINQIERKLTDYRKKFNADRNDPDLDGIRTEILDLVDSVK